VDPTEVSEAMRTAKDGNGAKLFYYGDFLTSQHISGYFSRLAAAKRTLEADEHDSEDETPGKDLQSVLSDKVLSEVSIEHSQPIIYDSYNICELVLNSKLWSRQILVNYFFKLGSDFRKETWGSLLDLAQCPNCFQMS